MRIKRGGFWLRYGLCLVMCLIWVSPISAMSTFSVSENIAEREAVRKGEWQWIRSQVDFDWIERRVSANLDYIRIERDMAWTRLAIREIRRIQRYHLRVASNPVGSGAACAGTGVVNDRPRSIKKRIAGVYLADPSVI